MSPGQREGPDNCRSRKAIHSVCGSSLTLYIQVRFRRMCYNMGYKVDFYGIRRDGWGRAALERTISTVGTYFVFGLSL